MELLHWMSMAFNLRVSLNLLALAKISFLDTVDFGKLDVLLLESSCSLFIVGGESLAVSTPIDLSVWVAIRDAGH